MELPPIDKFSTENIIKSYQIEAFKKAFILIFRKALKTYI